MSIPTIQSEMQFTIQHISQTGPELNVTFATKEMAKAFFLRVKEIPVTQMDNIVTLRGNTKVDGYELLRTICGNDSSKGAILELNELSENTLARIDRSAIEELEIDLIPREHNSRDLRCCTYDSITKLLIRADEAQD